MWEQGGDNTLRASEGTLPASRQRYHRHLLEPYRNDTHPDTFIHSLQVSGINENQWDPGFREV